MDSRKLIEMQGVSEEARGNDSGLHTDTVKLVEMGDASVETKGIARGLELGYQPLN
jgi:hypothetical protein